MLYHQDTIAAVATPPGKGGIGIVRVSGPAAFEIGCAITQRKLKARYAQFTPMYDSDHTILDEGVVIYFKAPYSFTGEEVVEFQAHGGSVIVDLILQQCLNKGARVAEPGEFSQRAFLNDKMDLVQAEAVADMIDAASEKAARCAVRSLQGAFSEAINQLVDGLIKLRMYVEAAIDFPEEEIDFLSDDHIHDNFKHIQQQLDQVYQASRQGVLLSEGIQVVIAGKPNAGKSSLLNALAGNEAAIVTHIAGTTRDVLKENIQINGVPLHIIDTAGIRQSDDYVESMGIQRAIEAIEKADHILLVVDVADEQSDDPQSLLSSMIPDKHLPDKAEITYVFNKIDLCDQHYANREDHIYISAKHQVGIEALKNRILQAVGFNNQTEGTFTARRRHIHAMDQAKMHLHDAKTHLAHHDGELLAEELRMTQEQLATITGTFTADDLLGEIFSSFCIGK